MGKKNEKPVKEPVFVQELDELIELVSQRRELDERIAELRQDLLDRHGIEE